LEPEDTQLVAQMAAGQHSGLAGLYDRYGALLLGVAIRMMGDREYSEDLVHDVFLEAWRVASDYDAARGSVRAWLLIRLRSRALDRKRSGAATKITTLADLQTVERPVFQEEDPLLGPDRQRVAALLQSLPTEQRMVLELGYFDGLSSTEIADRLNIPVGTVKSRVATALERLRGSLR